MIGKRKWNMTFYNKEAEPDTVIFNCPMEYLSKMFILLIVFSHLEFVAISIISNNKHWSPNIFLDRRQQKLNRRLWSRVSLMLNRQHWLPSMPKESRN